MPDGLNHVSLPPQARPATASFISITDLARQHRTVDESYCALSQEGADHPSDDVILLTRELAFRDMILAMPARTIDDAAVQAGSILVNLGQLGDPTKANRRDLQERIEQAERGLASILGILIKHMAADPQDLLELYERDAYQREFGNMDRAMLEAGR